MLRASLAALRLSMASWATFRFHSGVMAGVLTNVILWIICGRGRGNVLRLPAKLIAACFQDFTSGTWPVWFVPRRIWWRKILSERWPPHDRQHLITVTNQRRWANYNKSYLIVQSLISFYHRSWEHLGHKNMTLKKSDLSATLHKLLLLTCFRWLDVMLWTEESMLDFSRLLRQRSRVPTKLSLR